MADETYRPDDGIQHGIDDNPAGDAKKGATLGGVGGAAVGAAAGSMVGPVGAVIGAVVGGVVGAGASGAAVGAIDQVDNDNNITGVGDSVAYDNDADDDYADNTLVGTSATGGASGTMGYQNPATTNYGTGIGNDIPGIQTGGLNNDGTPDTRGVTEKVADAVTGDRYDDKTGSRI